MPMRHLAILLLILVPLGSVARAHPFHVSAAEVEHNRETKSLEISLRVHPDDLEKALGQRARRRIDLERSDGIDELIAEYLRERFMIRRAKGVESKHVWIGKEIDVKHAWLYFEIPVPNGVDGLRISNRVFFELHREQSNLVTFKAGERRASLRLTPERPEALIGWKLASGGLSFSRRARIDKIPGRPSALDTRCTFGVPRHRSFGVSGWNVNRWTGTYSPSTPSPSFRSSRNTGTERRDRAYR
jgi:hypothetical protein